MPRFSDEWVVDRTMFEYIQGGSCQCCGIPHLFNVNGIRGLIDACTDLETDAANAELNALEKAPWPPKMGEEIWADRVKLRLKMKRDMKKYKEFFKTHDVADILQWSLETLGAARLRKLFQMPRSEVGQIVANTYGIGSAYSVLLCSVTEQVANFEHTKYEVDSRGEEEIEFEELLFYDLKEGFVLPMNDEIARDVMEAYLQYMVMLRGPKLLARTPSRVSDNDSDDGEDDKGGADDAPKAIPKKGRSGPSFRSDRRLIRLLIGRYWADRIIEQYTNHLESLKGDLTKVEEEPKTE